MSENLILVDDKDNLLGYASRQTCHTGRGRRHRAFVTLIFDENNRVLLHRRRHKLFDGLWDMTAISHPLRINGQNETYQKASDRALFKEMGIAHVPIEKISAFNYFARDGENCENEYCAILVGHYDGDIKPNKNEVYEIEQVAFENFIKDVEKNPQKYTPWAKIAAKQLTKSKVRVNSQSLLKEELSKFLEIFDSYLGSYFQKKSEMAANYPKLIRQFYKDLADFSTGGKKLRAFLVWLGYQIGGSSRQARTINKILPIALAYELAHNFLLIHDDIIDESDRRRGKSTIHKRYEKIFGSHYGMSQAIVLGDIACFEAFDLVNSSEFTDSQKVACQNQLIATLLETGYGEALDIEYSFRQATLEEIRQMIELKTAKYSFVGPLTLGVVLAEASRSQLETLAKFGLSVGCAFQLQDDILGVFGDEKILGKSILSDLREGKNTLLVYKARELVKGQDKKDLARLWGKKDAKMADLKKIRQIIISSGAFDWNQAQKKKLVGEAKVHIQKITEELSLRQILSQLADFVIERES